MAHHRSVVLKILWLTFCSLSFFDEDLLEKVMKQIVWYETFLH